MFQCINVSVLTYWGQLLQLFFHIYIHDQNDNFLCEFLSTRCFHCINDEYRNFRFMEAPAVLVHLQFR
jgi:hypothetical protein